MWLDGYASAVCTPVSDAATAAKTNANTRRGDRTGQRVLGVTWPSDEWALPFVPVTPSPSADVPKRRFGRLLYPLRWFDSRFRSLHEHVDVAVEHHLEPAMNRRF